MLSPPRRTVKQSVCTSQCIISSLNTKLIVVATVFIAVTIIVVGTQQCRDVQVLMIVRLRVTTTAMMDTLKMEAIFVIADRQVLRIYSYVGTRSRGQQTTNVPPGRLVPCM